MEPVARENFVFSHKLRVRWSEVDAQGIVFNPHYLAYVDIALTEYLRDLGFSYPDAFLRLGVDTFAVRSEINFRGSAEYDDELELCARISRIGRSSMTLTVGIFRKNTLLCDIVMTYVCGQSDTKEPKPVPEAFIEAVIAFEKQPPERSSSRAAPAATG